MGHDSRDYEEIYINQREDEIDELKGTISEGDCCYEGCDGTMHYDEVCFICDKCKRSVHEDTYYYWYSGLTSDIVADDDYEEIYGEDCEY